MPTFTNSGAASTAPERGPTVTDTDERLTRVETILDVLAEQWERRFTTLQWTVGLGVTWLTVFIAMIAILKR